MATHFTALEREQLSAWLQMKISKAEIARRLGRDESTIFRELKRNSARRWYVEQHLKMYWSPDRSLAACSMTSQINRGYAFLLRPSTSGFATTIMPGNFALFCGVFA